MTKVYRVEIDEDAIADVTRITQDLTAESTNATRKFLAAFRQIREGLSSFPERGSVPRELEDLGIREFRQRPVAAYRAIYRVTDDAVYIHLVAHERQMLQPILQRRSLRPVGR